jgi:hypothetical protein
MAEWYIHVIIKLQERGIEWRKILKLISGKQNVKM